MLAGLPAAFTHHALYDALATRCPTTAAGDDESHEVLEHPADRVVVLELAVVSAAPKVLEPRPRLIAPPAHSTVHPPQLEKQCQPTPQLQQVREHEQHQHHRERTTDSLLRGLEPNARCTTPTDQPIRASASTPPGAPFSDRTLSGALSGW